MKRIIIHCLAAVLIYGLLALPADSTAATPGEVMPVPLRIAEQRPADLRLGGGDVAAIARPAMQREIRTEDASFMKIHFDHFSLPAGVTLEVASPDGREVYRYSKQHRDNHTVAADLGQNGRTSFSAMSIHGPVAVLRLVGVAREPWHVNHGVRVSKYLEGYPEDMLPQLQQEGLLDGGAQPLSICGIDDKKAAACYASSDSVAYERSRPVARILKSNGSVCTAWRVGPDNRMFTNNHCTLSGIAGSEVWFNYQLASCGGSSATPTKVSGSTILKTDKTLDYTLFTVNSFASIRSFGYLGLDVRVPIMNEEFFIAGHPGGRQKELTVVSDKDGGGHCRINNPSVNGEGANTDAGYYCDTQNGSSGSPVLARSSNRALLLHHSGGCRKAQKFNQGVKMSLIWPQVSSHFGGVVPAGDNEGRARTYRNTMHVMIPDAGAAVTSKVTVAERTGNGGSATPVKIHIVHPNIGDLVIDLVAPDGSVYNLHNKTGGSADNINKTVDLNLSGEALNGAWGLRARDGAAGNTGKINSWSITF